MFQSTSSSSSTSSLLSQNFLGNVQSRRLLLHTSLRQPLPNTATPPLLTTKGDGSSESYMRRSSFDMNVVMILSVLLFAVICVIGMNWIIRCALKCSRIVVSESGDDTANRRANTGVKRKALKTFPILPYSTGLKLPGLDCECVICLSEFMPGECVRVLPKCHHGFHIQCIDKWLMSHSSCPTCRQCLIDTCPITGCSQASSDSSSEPPLPLQVGILPLEPEGLIRNYWGTP